MGKIDASSPAVMGYSKPAVSRAVRPWTSPPSQEHYLHFAQNLLVMKLHCNLGYTLSIR